MDVPILIDDYIAEWADLDDTAYRDAVDGLARTLCHEHRIAHLVRFIMDAVVAPLASDPDRRHKLRDLASQKLAWRARDGFDQLTELLPPRLGHIRCYLVPAVGNHGAGVCIAAGDLAVCVPVDGDAAGWLLPTAAHEYSHTHRAFNQFQPVTIRDNLVFEGLAMILPEEIAPWPVQRPPPSAEEEAAFWETTDFDASADDPEAHRMISSSVPPNSILSTLVGAPSSRPAQKAMIASTVALMVGHSAVMRSAYSSSTGRSPGDSARSWG